MTNMPSNLIFKKKRALGKLLGMHLDLTLMVTQGSIPYGSPIIAVLIFYNTLKKWIREVEHSKNGIPFEEF